jgi:hypothetical protein
MENNIIKLKINYHTDRQNMVTALANSGYKVWVHETENKSLISGTDYFVCFESRTPSTKGE